MWGCFIFRLRTVFHYLLAFRKCLSFSFYEEILRERSKCLFQCFNLYHILSMNLLYLQVIFHPFSGWILNSFFKRKLFLLFWNFCDSLSTFGFHLNVIQFVYVACKIHGEIFLETLNFEFEGLIFFKNLCNFMIRNFFRIRSQVFCLLSLQCILKIMLATQLGRFKSKNTKFMYHLLTNSPN
jgi:hypothetical protein